MRPVFIALEALDGVGKTTLARSLAARIGGVAMNTPGDGLRDVSGAVLEGLGPHQEARCLFYAASVIARGAEARRMVDGGASVVMDTAPEVAQDVIGYAPTPTTVFRSPHPT